MSSLLAKFTGRMSGSGSDENTTSSSNKGNNAHNRRREQVRRAQRTHRERRAKYLQGLEAEVAHLRVKDAKTVAELEHTRTINKRLRALLDANNILVSHDLDAIDPAMFTTAVEVLGAAGSQQRVQPRKAKFLAASDIAADLTDPQVAIEFILALEEPCLLHHHSHVGEDGEVGHAMLLQSSVLQYAPSTVSTALGNQSSTGSSWNVPRAQLEEQLSRLLNTSLKLNLKNEMTPIMCWNKVQEQHEARSMSGAQFQKLRRKLVDDMVCYGFGAVIDEKPFHATMNEIFQAS